MTDNLSGSKGGILLAAGGTGGHLFPAEALAHELIARGYHVELATDKRAERFTGEFPADAIHVIRSATVVSKNPIQLAKTFFALFSGYRQSRKIITRMKPKLAIGFGGYPTIPPILAAAAMGLPTMVHEQNAIIGRANRMLSTRIKALAIGFKQVGKRVDVPLVETGNPVRPRVLDVMERPYPDRKPGEPFNLVVFGGSQGARFFSEALPEALALIDERARTNLRIVQQAREEDVAALKSGYAKLGLEADISPFFADMPARIADAHFVIARGGASSVTELAVIGRPSILVPLPGALDGDQAANAIAMADAGGAFVEKQVDLSAERLCDLLKTAMDEPGRMTEMARYAKSTGKADASKRLADCVECVISGGDVSTLAWS